LASQAQRFESRLTTCEFSEDHGEVLAIHPALLRRSLKPQWKFPSRSSETAFTRNHRPQPGHEGCTVVFSPWYESACWILGYNVGANFKVRNQIATSADRATPTHAQRRVAILMAVFNGAAFLEDQIETLARQSVSNIDIWASDDGSKDSSPQILKQAAHNWEKGSFHILKGPGRGFAENFRFLLANGAPQTDYVAFCDQDDLWEEDKLANALQWLEAQDADKPALFCSRTSIIMEDGTAAGCSPQFRRPPSFRNALVQSIAGANTIVMNWPALELVREAARRASFVSHDWWCYLLVTGVGGAIHYSAVPRVKYRQHQYNAIGANSSWRARFSRIMFLLRGRLAEWNEQNLAGLESCWDLLTPDARETIRVFQQARSGSLPARLIALVRSGVYRQTILGQLGMYFGCVLRKL
jgi:hypothetical protein